jgi:AcrR family transcriptional regulator
LEAALSSFASRGFDGASIRDIASSVGLNHGLIKYHFSSKEELWKESVEFLFARMEEELAEEEDPESSPVERLKNGIRRYVHYCAKHPEHARIMVQESTQRTDRLVWAVRKFIFPQHDQLFSDIKSDIGTGLWPNVNPISLTYIVVAAAQTIFMLAPEAKIIHKCDVTDRSFVDSHADAIISLFFEHKIVE